MSYADWKEKTSEFKKIDVRGVAQNFLEGLKKTGSSTFCRFWYRGRAEL